MENPRRRAGQRTGRGGLPENWRADAKSGGKGEISPAAAVACIRKVY